MQETDKKDKLDIGSRVIYKNNQFIAFNKPASIGVQPDKSDRKSLVELGEIYTHSKLRVIHRIDQPATGVVLFAKNDKALAALNQQFQDRAITKKYLAVVGQLPPKKEDVLVHFLQKNAKLNKSFVTKDKNKKNAKKAVLTYKLLGSSERYHLLEITLETGRHHQIRAQLSAIGCPIKGDVKYGFRRGNKGRSIHLHAWKLGFQHPVSEEQVELIAELPTDPVWDALRGYVK